MGFNVLKNLLHKTCQRKAIEMNNDAELIKRRQELLGPAYRLFYDSPFHPVRGEGVWLYDKDGNAYLDAYNNVPCVGHCQPDVVEAICRQAQTLNTHTRYLGETILEYAEELLGTFPKEINNVMFTCTGSEANDLALRIAKAHTEGTGVIVTEFAYHGVTTELAKMSPSLGGNNAIGDHVFLIPAPKSDSDDVNVGREFANGVQNAINKMRTKNIKLAALMVDTIFSSDGVFSEPKGFLQEAVNLVHAEGGVFIADEVQAGLGRTGECMWGFERHGVLPDIVSMGKPMGNGHPLAGITLQSHLLDKFSSNSRYFNTFGGNAVSCAAGLAVLKTIKNQRLQTNSLQVGNYLKQRLQDLSSKYPCIAEVRGAGLFIGVEIDSRDQRLETTQDLAKKIVNNMREKRVLISAAGVNANILKIRPPLVFSRENADVFIERLEEVLNSFN